MDKTLGYIFSQLRDNEIAVKVLNRVLRRQAKLNRISALTNLLISVYILVNEVRWNAQEQINKDLRKELNALKQMKGE